MPGAVLGTWAGGQEVLAAAGVLNRATRVRVTTDSLFQVGSITRLCTATMIMQLTGEGLLIPPMARAPTSSAAHTIMSRGFR